MNIIYARAVIDVPVSRQRAFDAAAGLDAPSIIRPYGPIPGVRAIEEGHAGPWSETGQSRVVRLTDGNSVFEKVDVFLPGIGFAYDVGEFTGPFAALVDQAYSEWEFQDLAPDRSRILWRYSFLASTPLTHPPLLLVITLFYGGFLKAALKRLAAHIRANATAAPASGTASALTGPVAENT